MTRIDWIKLGFEIILYTGLVMVILYHAWSDDY